MADHAAHEGRNARAAAGRLGLVLSVLAVLCGGSARLHAQFQMPDPKQMSGIPRPVTDLPDRAISVRVIRGQLSNNLTSIPVELHIGSKVQKVVKTDDAGRAQFNDVPAGATVKAVTVVDGEHLESQEFPSPTTGGVRLLLVATDKIAAGGSGTASAAPAISGTVSLGGQSRIVMEPGDDTVQIYYLLEIVNTAQARRVSLPAPFMS